MEETDTNGRKTVVHHDGTKELWMDGIKSRLYVNGIIKIVFPDGSEETRWPNGQTRIKDEKVWQYPANVRAKCCE